MIRSFGDQTTADLFHGTDTKAARAIPKAIWSVVRRKLDALNAASDVKDLRAPPGNRLERLKGDLAGAWSIRVNDQFRIVFLFESGAAEEVRVADYHS